MPSCETRSVVKPLLVCVLGLVFLGAARTPEPYVPALDVGATLPDFRLLDQGGRPFSLTSGGRASIVAFVYTRCPDPHICTLVSAKFAWLQSRIDPATMRLVEITLDPAYDTPTVLKRYAGAFGVRPDRWTLATGTRAEIETLSRRLGIVASPGPGGIIVHSDALIILDPAARIAARVEGTAWGPDQALALAQSALRQRTNPFARVALALASGVTAICGGGTSGITLAGAIGIFIVLVVALGLVTRYAFLGRGSAGR